ncbi:hypothetical protein MN608_09702 [Microdochium nivale]|nr:hypothetical protein MN608_09702 [Microdochium nivale]
MLLGAHLGASTPMPHQTQMWSPRELPQPIPPAPPPLRRLQFGDAPEIIVSQRTISFEGFQFGSAGGFVSIRGKNGKASLALPACAKILACM